MSVWSYLFAKQPNVVFARGLQNDRVHKGMNYEGLQAIK
jgi:hypothetical protein